MYQEWQERGGWPSSEDWAQGRKLQGQLGEWEAFGGGFRSSGAEERLS